MALLEMRGSGEFEPAYTFEPPRTITTAGGQTYNYDDVVNLILSRYAEGKTPALAVKSALQLGFPEDVIRTLPGVDEQAFQAGKQLIESGAFTEQATGTMADIQQAAPVGSAQYNARIAAGLDAFGFPPEEVSRLRAQGLYGPGKQFDPGDQDQKRTIGSVSETEARAGEAGLLSPGPQPTPQAKPLIPEDVKSQLDAFGPYDPNSEVWYYGGPQIVSDGKIYRKDPSGNIDITVAGGGPGSLQQVVSPTGELLLSTTDTGETSRLMAFAQNALPAAAAAALLGPAGAGLLSTPAAAAVGSGGTTLAKGGSIEDALKAAVLSGTAAYGLDYLLSSPELLAARELASSGMSEDAIVDTLISRGVNTQTAIEAASNATGLPAAGANRGIGTVTPTGTAPVGGIIEASTLGGAGGLAASTAPALAGALLNTGTAPGLLNQPSDITNQQVQLQNQTQPGGQNLTSTAPAALGGLLNQQVQLQEQKTTPPSKQDTAPAASLLTSTAPTQRVETTTQRDVPVEDRPIPTLAIAPTIPVKATEAVTVEGKKESVPTATALIPSTAAGVTAAATPTSNITAKDAALAALLLGGAGSLGGGGQVGDLVSGPISGVIPTYPGRGTYQMPGLFQIAPTNVYNPFATVAPFGAGRFGAVNQPITLPYGLLAGPIGLTAGINQPTRGLV